MQSAKPDSKPRSSPKPSLPPDCELADHNADAPIIPPITSKWKIACRVFLSAFMLLIAVMWLYMSLAPMMPPTISKWNIAGRVFLYSFMMLLGSYANEGHWAYLILWAFVAL